ncbi:HAD-IIIC family phosphatase [Nonomuraea sp. PA05]|uniref:HAD-IIIC family phosphatase n=1 Tax=Nonomuraea sp. PA05 TaxID=2604466 RepID=UPI0011DBDAEE|nr:HAD-IIIC family phosphatase [Nonomuraea sp. PA05]TYB55398.1 HAD-IIIC family phosphatase [Nonomuraea sp. PA05]
MKTIKCLVWDLDDTLWEGVLLEGDGVRLRPHVLDTLKELDGRGILHSVSSRNDGPAALDRLATLGVLDYFLVPQIGWDAKSGHVARIAGELGLGLDTFAFVDDDPFERAEVAHGLPGVRCYDSAAVASLPGLPDFRPAVVSDESGQRRQLYRADHLRRTAETRSGLSRQDFLATLGLRFEVRRASEADLGRAHELTIRTHQLNTTGITFGEEELRELIHSPAHQVLVASLSDTFGGYGTIGLAVLELAPGSWRLPLLLTSCRVISRGAGSLLLQDVIRRAYAAGVRLRAEMIPTGANRAMLVALRLAGFAVTGEEGGRMLLELTPSSAPAPPPHVVVRSDG